LTFIAALRNRGIGAPCLFDGPINGEVFLQAWRSRDYGQFGQSSGKAVRQAIRKARAKLLFLPKYSPDPNPIEQVFSKLKHLLRKAQGRSYGALLKATGKLLNTFSPEECCNYLKNCSYGFI